MAYESNLSCLFSNLLRSIVSLLKEMIQNCLLRIGKKRSHPDFPRKKNGCQIPNGREKNVSIPVLR